MNVEKTAKKKPLIPQKFLQSIMFLLCMRHTTTAITYIQVSIFTIYFNIYYKPSLCIMETGFHCVQITTAGNYFFVTGNSIFITGNPVYVTGNPVFITEHPVFITENYWT